MKATQLTYAARGMTAIMEELPTHPSRTMLSMEEGQKSSLYKHLTAAYGAAMAIIPSKIGYEGCRKIRHAMVAI